MHGFTVVPLSTDVTPFYNFLVQFHSLSRPFLSCLLKQSIFLNRSLPLGPLLFTFPLSPFFANPCCFVHFTCSLYFDIFFTISSVTLILIQRLFKLWHPSLLFLFTRISVTQIFTITTYTTSFWFCYIFCFCSVIWTSRFNICIHEFSSILPCFSLQYYIIYWSPRCYTYFLSSSLFFIPNMYRSYIHWTVSSCTAFLVSSQNLSSQHIVYLIPSSYFLPFPAPTAIPCLLISFFTTLRLTQLGSSIFCTTSPLNKLLKHISKPSSLHLICV